MCASGLRVSAAAAAADGAAGSQRDAMAESAADRPSSRPDGDSTSEVDEDGLLASRSGTAKTAKTTVTAATSHSPHAMHFFSGNPSVEKTEGIIHLYKDRLGLEGLAG